LSTWFENRSSDSPSEAPTTNQFRVLRKHYIRRVSEQSAGAPYDQVGDADYVEERAAEQPRLPSYSIVFMSRHGLRHLRQLTTGADPDRVVGHYIGLAGCSLCEGQLMASVRRLVRWLRSRATAKGGLEHRNRGTPALLPDGGMSKAPVGGCDHSSGNVLSARREGKWREASRAPKGLTTDHHAVLPC